MKLKTNPTERMNRRYLLLQADSKSQIEKEIEYFLGAIGTSKVSPLFLEDLELKKDEFVLVVNRKELENVRAAFELSKQNIKIKKVSGTIKGLGF